MILSTAGYAFAICLAIVNSGLPEHQVRRACKLMPKIVEISSQEQVNPLLVVSIIQVESSWNPKAVSNKGACGLMQVVPKWNPKKDGTKYTCDELKNPELNIRVGARALKRWSKRSGGDTPTAICAYNAGNICFKRIRTTYLHKVEKVFYTLIAMMPMNR